MRFDLDLESFKSARSLGEMLVDLISSSIRALSLFFLPFCFGCLDLWLDRFWLERADEIVELEELDDLDELDDESVDDVLDEGDEDLESDEEDDVRVVLFDL